MHNHKSQTYFYFLIFIIIFTQAYSLPKTDFYRTKDKNKTSSTLHYNKRPQIERQNKVLNNYWVSKVYVDAEHGNYYTTLFIGKNKSPQTYILDTGSPITSSPCKSCKKCGNHTNPYYDDQSSSNILNLHSTECSYLIDTGKNIFSLINLFKKYCTSNIGYHEGSTISGYYNNQIVYFHNILGNKSDEYSKPFEIPIGCTTEEKKSFYDQKVDGILGLSNKEKSFMNMLYETDTIRLNLFTLCFNDKGGYFALGRVDRTYHKSLVIKYVPILNKRNYYNIRILQILIGTKSIFNNNVAIIDTGNTLSYFPKNIYDKILKHFISHCQENNGQCGTFETTEKYGYCASFDSKSDLKNALNFWPTIFLILDGFQYSWNPTDYYYETLNNNKLYACLGFNIDNSQKITLGVNFIHGYDVIFDRQHQEIGFVRSDCSRTNITYIFPDIVHAYNFQRPKPIPVIQKHKNTTDDEDDDNDDEQTILDEFNDGRKKKNSISEYILSGTIIFGVIVLIILILCKSRKNIIGNKNEIFVQLDNETNSLEKEREELREYNNARANSNTNKDTKK